MRYYLTLCFGLFATLNAGSGHAATEQVSTQLNWYTNYQDALRAGQAASKPIALLFTGSDWCGWCIKLEQEILSSPAFAEAAGNKFVFVKVDFPKRTSLSASQQQQNEALQQKFGITGYPTIILVDPAQQKVIASTGYQAGGPKAFADHLSRLANKNNPS